MGESPVREERVFLGLGSNLGHREGYLSGGLGRLSRKGLIMVAISLLVESPPLGGLGQPPFLNLVVEGRWWGSPRDLLEAIRDVEEEEGRLRPFPNAPRTLDVDVILFGSRIVRTPDLRVPHPRWRSRSFVVELICSIDPGVVDPESGFPVREIQRLWSQEPVGIRVLGPGDFLLPAPLGRPTEERKEGQ